MLNLHQLKIFQTVVANVSYSRAADRLGISQPAVSMQLAKLEEFLGLKLLVQQGRQISLTEAGQTMARYADRLFEVHDAALRAMEDIRSLRRGRLRLAASSTPGAYLLPAVVAAFRAEYPGAEVSLRISNTSQAVRMVADGTVDLAAIGEPPADAPAEVEYQPLCADRLTVVVSGAHPWAERAAISPAELAAEPLILREAGSSTREVLDRRLADLGLKARPSLELALTDAVREAAAAGLGPAVLSGWAVRTELQTGRLRAVAVCGLSLERTLHLALLPWGDPGPLVSAFMGKLRTTAQGIDRA